MFTREVYLHIQISEQIQLTPLSESDASDILNLVSTNRVGLDEFLYWVKDVQCVNSARKYISDRINSGLNDSRWFKVYFKDNISGVFAVKSVCPNSLVAELGYWLCGAAQGHGIINQIVSHLPEILENTDTKAIEFRCLEKNHASIKIALRSGATLVDFIPDFMVANGVKQDLNIYRLQL